MSPAHRPPWSHCLLAGILVALFLAQSFFASLRKSPVFDEPPHIASGLSYVETGVFHANPQHPPLLKEMSALVLSLAGIHWLKSEAAQAVIRGGPDGANLEWGVGNDIIHQNGPARVMFWARLPFILLAALLGVLVYWWGRELVGETAALGALFLYALDPTMVAHSFLVTTDVGLAAFGMLFLFTVWRYAQHANWQRLVICGLALGAAMGAKFSGLFLLPVAGILLLAAAVVRRQLAPAARVAKVAPNQPCPCGSGKKYRKCHGAEPASPGAAFSLDRRKALTYAAAFLAMCAIAAVVVEALYFFPRDPFLYVEGLRKVNADHGASHPVYFHGDLAKRFSLYFVEAYLLKEPLAAIFLAAAGLWAVLRGKSTPFLTKLFLLLPPAVFVLAMTVFADNIGIRYILPALPFAHLLGGVGLAALLGNGRTWGRSVAAGLCLWVVVAAAGIYPDHLSYFNESACLLEAPGLTGLDGGSRCGPAWLDDSNVDWGQSLPQLRAWMERHGKGRTLRLLYFGSFPPEWYGVQYENLELADVMADPAPGLYAVSAHAVAYVPALGAQYVPGAGSWLRHTQPVDVVGHAFYIYEVR